MSSLGPSFWSNGSLGPAAVASDSSSGGHVGLSVSAVHVKHALLGLDVNFVGLERIAGVITAALGALGIQPGLLVAKRSWPKVSSKDFCGDGDVILGEL